MDDKTIVALYWERSEAAIAQSEQKYGKYCYRIADNILHCNEDAEECVNDTWVRAWNTIPPAHPDRLGQYLGGITRHISLDKHRHNTRQARGGGEVTVAYEEIHEVVDSGINVSTQVEQRELLLAIDRFLWSLPERECNVFIRRYYHLNPIKDVAKRYGLSVANTKKILSRTRAALRKFLEQEGYTV